MAESKQQMAPKGLAGVVVDQTTIADVQADGHLIYRGYGIEQLVERPWAEVAALVVDGTTPHNSEAWQPGTVGTGMGAELAEHCNLTPEEQAIVGALPRGLHPMRVIQALCPALLPAIQAGQAQDTRAAGLYVAAKLPAVILSYLHEQHMLLNAELDDASRFLAALQQCAPEELDPTHVLAFNCAQVLQLEHSFNAGAFAARVVASTLADVGAAFTAGFAALSGPLHGGADQAALQLVDTLPTADAIEAYVDEVLAEGGRLPGMGHREYRVRDPRAVFLERWAERLATAPQHAETLWRLKTLDRVFRQRMQALGKEVHANVEFYKGLVYRVVGLPDEYFTAAFGMARVFGYLAHVVENNQDSRIYRPAAQYVGQSCAT